MLPAIHTFVSTLFVHALNCRLSTICNADVVAVVNNGEVVRLGKPSDILDLQDKTVEAEVQHMVCNNITLYIELLMCVCVCVCVCACVRECVVQRGGKGHTYS